jgi:hypothetical protein
MSIIVLSVLEPNIRHTRYTQYTWPFYRVPIVIRTRTCISTWKWYVEIVWVVNYKLWCDQYISRDTLDVVIYCFQIYYQRPCFLSMPSSISLCNNLGTFLAFAPMFCHSILILQEIHPRLLACLCAELVQNKIYSTFDQ